ncbi:bacteriohemerythrin [Desulfuribacillus alkaliarsenatis]|uniref:Hemerythrin-like domain-containing protein n=1 Tax=Desulfuribacillus alkaliarsenatis TaxID=766136 RepID=A0A1E5G5M3_9FIRM|nr:bacteriohemerythrin [Desulfuribacillus alkaliarsenatis]OEF98395.1 hypothetical protein BHF68_01580 [Desulfuribacillus alkaliarsenatis]
MKVEWNKSLETGIGIIDDQHKKLIERIDAFVQAVNNDDIEVIEDTVDYLIGYTIQHFGAEELIMIRNGYAGFKEHRDKHSSFINMVYEAKKSLLNKELTKEQIHHMRDELLSWTVEHIMTYDKIMTEKINKKI